MVKVDKAILERAAAELYRDVGSLSDFPAGLRNTVASLYYEHWWFKTAEDESTGHPGWVHHAVTRMGQYDMVPTMLQLIRKTCAEKRTVSEMMVGTTRDLLRYNLQNVTGKSAARRAMEKLFRKPFHEVPGIYGLMEYVNPGLSAQESSFADISDSQGKQAGKTSPGDPDVCFIRELPDPSESRPERVIQYGSFSVSYYLHPKSYGEVVARVPSLYVYPQVAVIEEQTEPMLIVRTEKAVGGTTFICSVSRDGSRSNHGKFESTDPEDFLKRVTEEVSRLDAQKEQSDGNEAANRVVVFCPSCKSALRVSKGRAGNVRCTVCEQLFKART